MKLLWARINNIDLQRINNEGISIGFKEIVNIEINKKIPAYIQYALNIQ